MDYVFVLLIFLVGVDVTREEGEFKIIISVASLPEQCIFLRLFQRVYIGVGHTRELPWAWFGPETGGEAEF